MQAIFQILDSDCNRAVVFSDSLSALKALSSSEVEHQNYLLY